MSGSVLATAGDVVAKYEMSKGGLRFGAGERLPVGLLRQLIKLRLQKISTVENGRRCEYYLGEQTGTWTTWERDGSEGKTTRF